MAKNNLSQLVSILSASRPATELPRVRTRSRKDFGRSRPLEPSDFAPVLALCSNWDKEFLAPSMARSTAEAFTSIVCRLDHRGKIDEVPQNKAGGCHYFSP